jgi:hypothetical protein
VLSGGLVAPAHARVGGFGFGGLHVVGWSIWLQQLGGVGSRTTVVLSVRCCLPLGFSIGGGFRSSGSRYLLKCGMLGGVAVVLCLPCRRLCVERPRTC